MIPPPAGDLNPFSAAEAAIGRFITCPGRLVGSGTMSVANAFRLERVVATGESSSSSAAAVTVR